MKAALAVTRFGLGAKPGELDDARNDPQGFLKSQIRRSGADQPPGPTATSAQRMAEFRDYQREKRELRLEKTSDVRPSAPAGATMEAGAAPAMADAAPAKGQDARDPVKAIGRMLRQDIGADFAPRTQLAATTDAASRQRWTLFWANHSTVAATKGIPGTGVGRYEEEAIGPHVSGACGDLLAAAEPHRPMLAYLAQPEPTGRDSDAPQFPRRGGPRGVGARFHPAALQQ